jgi:hypothetical protein
MYPISSQTNPLNKALKKTANPMMIIKITAFRGVKGMNRSLKD